MPSDEPQLTSQPLRRAEKKSGSHPIVTRSFVDLVNEKQDPLGTALTAFRGLSVGWENEAPNRQHEFEELRADFFEQLMFQSLSPAFDDVPMRRVFPYVIYFEEGPAPLDDSSKLSLLRDLHTMLVSYGCHFVGRSTVLKGSLLLRTSAQFRTRMTRDEFVDLERGIIETVASAAQGKAVRITINNYQSGDTAHHGNWAESLKDLSEALKNLLLCGVAVTILFGGVLFSTKSSESKQPPQLTTTLLNRNEQLKVIPKILDANTASEFPGIVKEAVDPPKKQTK